MGWSGEEWDRRIPGPREAPGAVPRGEAERAVRCHLLSGCLTWCTVRGDDEELKQENRQEAVSTWPEGRKPTAGWRRSHLTQKRTSTWGPVAERLRAFLQAFVGRAERGPPGVRSGDEGTGKRMFALDRTPFPTSDRFFPQLPRSGQETRGGGGASDGPGVGGASAPALRGRFWGCPSFLRRELSRSQPQGGLVPTWRGCLQPTQVKRFRSIKVKACNCC